VGFVEYGTQANSGDGGDGSGASAATGFFLVVVRTVSELLPVWATNQPQACILLPLRQS
jgi:hypothetical protein